MTPATPAPDAEAVASAKLTLGFEVPGPEDESHQAGQIMLATALTAAEARIAELEAERDRLRKVIREVAIWLRNGDYDTRGGLGEMDRLAGVCESALPAGAAKDGGA